jgi:hypothetical protein
MDDNSELLHGYEIVMLLALTYFCNLTIDSLS